MEHNVIPTSEIHIAHNWEFADSTARLAFASAVPADVRKLALQLSDNTLWILTDDSPVTWSAVVTKTKAGLSNVDNTADLDKPVSTAQQTALDLKFDKIGGSISGDVVVTGTGRRSSGDMSNGTLSNRWAFQTSTMNGVTGFTILPNGTATTSRYNAHNSSDANNSAYAQFGVTSSAVEIGSSAAGSGTLLPITFLMGGSPRMSISASGGHVTPGADNTQNFGAGSLRWATIYAGTGTINTSDARIKTEVASLSALEIAAAKDLSKEIGRYQFLDAIAKKGDDARLHIGMTVQRAIEVMEVHGLDPMRYGFICHDAWDDQYEEVEDPDGDIVKLEQRPATEVRTVESQEVRMVDGRAVLTTAVQERELPLFDEFEVVDEDGRPVLMHHPAVLDDEGNEIVREAYDEPVIHRVARVEEVETRYSRRLVRAAGDLYSFRPEELLMFIARGFEARLSALENV